MEAVEMDKSWWNFSYWYILFGVFLWVGDISSLGKTCEYLFILMLNVYWLCLPCPGHSCLHSSSEVHLAFSRELPSNVVALFLLDAIFGWVLCFSLFFKPDLFSFARCSDHSSVFLQSVIKMPTEQDYSQLASGKPMASVAIQVGTFEFKRNTTLLLWLHAVSILSFLSCLKKLFWFA